MQPTEPNTVTEARDNLAKVRAAIARHRETAAANDAQLATAEAAYLRESTDAALEGLAAPKPPAAIKSLRDTAETSAAVLADLEARERLAKGDYESAVQAWGWGIVRAQVTDDAQRGHEALQDFAAAARRLCDALGTHGKYLAGRVIESIPHEVFAARVVRLGRFNGIFSAVGSRNPAQEIGDQMLNEAGAPTADDARALAQIPPPAAL